MTVELVRKSASATNGGELDSSVTQVIPGAKTFSGAVAVSGNLSASGAIAFDPTLLTDVQATKMGLKSYSHGTTYTGSPNSPTISGPAGLTVRRSKFIPYQMQDGTWRLRFNVQYSQTSANFSTMFVAGVVAEATALSYQAFSSSQQNFAGGGRGEIDPSNSGFTVSYSAAFTAGCMSGDIELASKPTWAY